MSDEIRHELIYSPYEGMSKEEIKKKKEEIEAENRCVYFSVSDMTTEAVAESTEKSFELYCERFFSRVKKCKKCQDLYSEDFNRKYCCRHKKLRPVFCIIEDR